MPIGAESAKTPKLKDENRAKRRSLGPRGQSQSCHQCRQSIFSSKGTCEVQTGKDRLKCGTCTRFWCEKCLQNRYGISKGKVGAQWKCPFCSGQCNCSVCRKKEGKLATGILSPLVKNAGYSSVSEFLDKGKDEVAKCLHWKASLLTATTSAGPQMPQPVLINPSGRGPYSCTKSMQLSVEKLSASMLARVPSGQCSDTPPGGVKRAPSQPSDTPLGGVKRAPSQPSDTPLGGVKRAPSQPSSAQPGAKRRCLTHSMYSISVEEEDNDDDGDSSAVKGGKHPEMTAGKSDALTGPQTSAPIRLGSTGMAVAEDGMVAGGSHSEGGMVAGSSEGREPPALGNTSPLPVNKKKHGDLVKGKHGDLVKGKHGDLVKGKQGDLVKGKQGDLVKEKHGDLGKRKHGVLVKGKQGDLVKGKQGDLVKGKHGDLVKGEKGDLVKGKHGDLVKEKHDDLPGTTMVCDGATRAQTHPLATGCDASQASAVTVRAKMATLTTEAKMAALTTACTGAKMATLTTACTGAKMATLTTACTGAKMATLTTACTEAKMAALTTAFEGGISEVVDGAVPLTLAHVGSVEASLTCERVVPVMAQPKTTKPAHEPKVVKAKDSVPSSFSPSCPAAGPSREPEPGHTLEGVLQLPGGRMDDRGAMFQHSSSMAITLGVPGRAGGLAKTEKEKLKERRKEEREKLKEKIKLERENAKLKLKEERDLARQKLKEEKRLKLLEEKEKKKEKKKEEKEKEKEKRERRREEKQKELKELKQQQNKVLAEATTLPSVEAGEGSTWEDDSVQQCTECGIPDLPPLLPLDLPMPCEAVPRFLFVCEFLYTYGTILKLRRAISISRFQALLPNGRGMNDVYQCLLQAVLDTASSHVTEQWPSASHVTSQFLVDKKQPRDVEKLVAEYLHASGRNGFVATGSGTPTMEQSLVMLEHLCIEALESRIISDCIESSAVKLEEMRKKKRQELKDRIKDYSEQLKQMSEEGKSLEELREQRDHFAEKLTVLRRKLDCARLKNGLTLRNPPLGIDRHGRVYWKLQCFEGLLLEVTPEHQSSSSSQSSSEATWVVIESREEVKQFISYLHPRGRREGPLLDMIKVAFGFNDNCFDGNKPALAQTPQ